MAELRWNPLLKTWTMVNAARQKRPDLPQDWCPFCPGEGKKVPPKFDVFKYDNDFPILSPTPSAPDFQELYSGHSLYRVSENYGKCEVILYSDRHTKQLPQLSVDHIAKLVDLWAERNEALSKDPKIKYVFVFENRGREVGATMPHPHGQIYAFPHIPQKINIELDNCRDYYNENRRCMICDMNTEESRFKKRIISENDGFLAYVPFFTDYPYGVFITAKRHFGNLSDMSAAEQRQLAAILRDICGAYDCLYGQAFPYMMVMHQAPVNSPEYSDSSRYYHFHIEFYPPFRDKGRVKYYASSEMGAWAAANTLRVEDTAEKLREALDDYQANGVSAEFYLDE